ncbi:MAG TPA: hypothetical protein VF534_13525 [Paraburkholderia sp.]
MFKRITDRISTFGIGRTPVGSIFLVVVFGVLGLAALIAYWYAIDLIPRWVDKVAFLYFAVYVYGVHVERKARESHG